MAERQSKELKKWLAAKRAQFKLEQTMDYIDFVEDELVPAVEAVKNGASIKTAKKTNAALAAQAIQVEVKELGK